jgi:hypothetical protein
MIFIDILVRTNILLNICKKLRPSICQIENRNTDKIGFHSENILILSDFYYIFYCLQ